MSGEDSEPRGPRCRRCHKPLSPEEHQWYGTLCVECLHIVTTGARQHPPEDREELRVILQAWHLPETTPLTYLYSPSEALKQRVPGFRVETVYAPCSGWGWVAPRIYHRSQLSQLELASDEHMKEEWQARDWPDVFPMLDIHGQPLPEEDRDYLIEIRFRVWRPGKPGFLETRWDPTTRARGRFDFRDFDPKTAKDDFGALRQIVRTHGRGRPRGTANITSREHLIELVLTARQAIEGTPGKGMPATQREVAEYCSHYFSDVREIYRQCERFGITWNELQALPRN